MLEVVVVEVVEEVVEVVVEVVDVVVGGTVVVVDVLVVEGVEVEVDELGPTPFPWPQAASSTTATPTPRRSLFNRPSYRTCHQRDVSRTRELMPICGGVPPMSEGADHHQLICGRLGPPHLTRAAE